VLSNDFVVVCCDQAGFPHADMRCLMPAVTVVPGVPGVPRACLGRLCVHLGRRQLLPAPAAACHPWRRLDPCTNSVVDIIAMIRATSLRCACCMPGTPHQPDHKPRHRPAQQPLPAPPTAAVAVVVLAQPYVTVSSSTLDDTVTPVGVGRAALACSCWSAAPAASDPARLLLRPSLHIPRPRPPVAL
jgi:hypothetical protein